ncbi:MAG: (Fe-S)-binding protein [Chloroflexi bacterium]|nr:(Fe-S)-binding protein [Chloroflexota bacterium]
MRARVQVFATCLGENFFSDVLKDMVTVLERLGVQCEFPEGQTCCGQPFYNSGFQSQTLALARNWLRAFANTTGYIVAPSGSCTDFVRHRYLELFPPGAPEHPQVEEIASRAVEFTEFLTRVLKVTEMGAHFPHKVTYHAACHSLRNLGLRDEPKLLLQAVEGLELVPLAEEETCCGFGGVFSVIYPEVSRAMMDAKVKNIQASGAEYIVTNEPGCLMNISGVLQRIGSPIKPMHLIQILASSKDSSRPSP